MRKLASDATGIDPAFILAILDRESALGQNVGQCSYKTAMSPSNIPMFLQITQSLNLDPEHHDGFLRERRRRVWRRDGAGAIRAVDLGALCERRFGRSPATIRRRHGTTPTPLSRPRSILKDAMTGCKAIYSSTVSQERCTAAKYYAGSRWKNYLWTYGEAVVERAQSFAGDIQTITLVAQYHAPTVQKESFFKNGLAGCVFVPQRRRVWRRAS